jgi:hypothetical protein
MKAFNANIVVAEAYRLLNRRKLRLLTSASELGLINGVTSRPNQGMGIGRTVLRRPGSCRCRFKGRLMGLPVWLPAWTAISSPNASSMQYLGIDSRRKSESVNDSSPIELFYPSNRSSARWQKQRKIKTAPWRMHQILSWPPSPWRRSRATWTRVPTGLWP